MLLAITEGIFDAWILHLVLNEDRECICKLFPHILWTSAYREGSNVNMTLTCHKDNCIAFFSVIWCELVQDHIKIVLQLEGSPGCCLLPWMNMDNSWTVVHQIKMYEKAHGISKGYISQFTFCSLGSYFLKLNYKVVGSASRQIGTQTFAFEDLASLLTYGLLLCVNVCPNDFCLSGWTSCCGPEGSLPSHL